MLVIVCQRMKELSTKLSNMKSNVKKSVKLRYTCDVSIRVCIFQIKFKMLAVGAAKSELIRLRWGGVRPRSLALATVIILGSHHPS